MTATGSLEHLLEQERRARAEAEARLAAKEKEFEHLRQKYAAEYQQRRHSEGVLYEAIENMSEGFVIYDPNDRLLMSNGKNAEIYFETCDLFVQGVSFEEIVRESAARGQYACTGELDAWIEHRLEIYRNSSGPFVERLANGKWIRVCDRKTFDGHTVGVRTDISELAESKLRQVELESQLRQVHKLDALGTLAGSTAHEFNNMLVPMIGLTELVMDGLRKGSVERNNLARVLEAGERARNLIHQILSFSREQRHEPKVLDLTATSRSALRLLSTTLPRSIEFEVSLPGDPVPVWGDETELHQIYMNLVSNAVQAVGGLRGKIEVYVRGPSRARRGSPGGRASITVRDNGCGMSKETLRRVFEPFFTTKPVGEGTGLGLSMIHAIVTRADGSISVKSEPGKGTEFVIYYPVSSGRRANTPDRGVGAAA